MKCLFYMFNFSFPIQVRCQLLFHLNSTGVASLKLWTAIFYWFLIDGPDWVGVLTADVFSLLIGGPVLGFHWLLGCSHGIMLLHLIG